MKAKNSIMNFANEFDKELLYESYLQFYRLDAKDYKSITKKKMVEAILQKLTPKYILSICTCRELRYLEKLLSNDKQTILKLIRNQNEYDFEINALERKCLIISHTVWDEFVEPIQEALKLVDWEKKEQEDNKVIPLLGYLRSTVIVDKMIMEALAAISCDGNEEEGKKLLTENPLFNYYAEFNNRCENEKGLEVPVFIYFEYKKDVEEIIYRRSKYEFVTPKFLKDTSYCSIFYNGYDQTNEVVNDFFEKIKKESIIFSSNKDSLLLVIRLLMKDENVDMLGLKSSSTKDWKTIKRLLPSAVLRGMSLEDYEQGMKKREEMNKLRNLNVPQKYATLSEKDAKLFYKYYFSVLNFVNEKYKVDPYLNFVPGNHLSSKRAIEVSRVLWEHKDEVFDEYLKLNPLKLTKRGLNTINGFRQGFRKDMILYRYEEKYAVFMDEENVYMVKGLYDNIDHLIGADYLPVPVDVAILPFAGSIVIDGLLSHIPVSIGPNQMEKLEQDFQNNPKIYSFEISKYH